MRYLVIPLILMMLLPLPALAQQPTPTVPTDTGYTFEPYDFENGNTVDISGELAVFMEPQFIDPMGSTAITVWGMIDAADVMGIFIVLLLGLAVVWWVYSWVINGKAQTNRDSQNPFK